MVAAKDSIAMAAGHVAALARLLTELLPLCPGLTFIGPFVAWCVLSTATVDLVWLSLGNAAEHAEASARSVIFGRFLQDRALLDSWPSHMVLLRTHNFYSTQAFAYCGALINS